MTEDNFQALETHLRKLRPTLSGRPHDLVSNWIEQLVTCRKCPELVPYVKPMMEMTRRDFETTRSGASAPSIRVLTGE